jgi:hypothetical protein
MDFVDLAGAFWWGFRRTDSTRLGYDMMREMRNIGERSVWCIKNVQLWIIDYSIYSTTKLTNSGLPPP